MFDAHFHWFPGRLIDRARQAHPDLFLLQLPFERIEDSVRIMDANGVETALIVYNYYLEMMIASSGVARNEAYRITNEGAAEICQRYPGRFLQCAALDVMAGQEAVTELERAVKEYGCSALSMHTCYERDGDTVFPHERSFWPLYRKAEELGIPIFVHPCVPPFWRKLPSSVQFTAADWGFLVGNQFAINLLAYSGVFEAFPRLQFIFCQLGGFIPFSLGRSDLNYEMYKEFNGRLPADPNLKVVKLRDYAGRFYVDIHSMDGAAIQCAVENLGVDHILFATDYPITPVHMGSPWHLKELRKSRLGEEAIQAITSGNARALFGPR